MNTPSHSVLPGLTTNPRCIVGRVREDGITILSICWIQLVHIIRHTYNGSEVSPRMVTPCGYCILLREKLRIRSRSSLIIELFCSPGAKGHFPRALWAMGLAQEWGDLKELPRQTQLNWHDSVASFWFKEYCCRWSLVNTPLLFLSLNSHSVYQERK